ncbi:hypothetical protein BDY24DRAFT_396245 [Mrakia frigida]|uniref:uncharacterized protein n=1 Tax=Mrakia frigida TaxID=29902 RepID=UPI003FCBF54B
MYAVHYHKVYTLAPDVAACLNKPTPVVSRSPNSTVQYSPPPPPAPTPYVSRPAPPHFSQSTNIQVPYGGGVGRGTFIGGGRGGYVGGNPRGNFNAGGPGFGEYGRASTQLRNDSSREGTNRLARWKSRSPVPSRPTTENDRQRTTRPASGSQHRSRPNGDRVLGTQAWARSLHQVQSRRYLLRNRFWSYRGSDPSLESSFRRIHVRDRSGRRDGLRQGIPRRGTQRQAYSSKSP